MSFLEYCLAAGALALSVASAVAIARSRSHARSRALSAKRGDGQAPVKAPSLTRDTRDASGATPTPKALEPASAPSQRPNAARDLSGLRSGLAATRGGFIAKLKAIVGGPQAMAPELLERIEEVMLASDVGVRTTQTIVSRLHEKLKRHELANADAVWDALRAEALRIVSLESKPFALASSRTAPSATRRSELAAPSAPDLAGSAKSDSRTFSREKPIVVLMVGVNGVGKTTTIGKLAHQWSQRGHRVMVAAADTFRAAAVAQLEVWAERTGVEIVKGRQGADPSAIAYEAIKKAQESGIDIVLIDTAGRLHTKVNLMDEITKVKRTIAKAMDGAPHETLLVVDATTGQNALAQATHFKNALDLTGVVLTKLDGTAKGGVILSVCDELTIPVRYIGLGEQADDLREFIADDFVDALFARDRDDSGDRDDRDARDPTRTDATA